MRRAILLVPFCALSFACADDDVGDAADGWRAANEALSLGQSSFEAEVEIGVDASLDVECPDGGTIAIEGSYASEDEFSLSVAYSGCQASGVRVDGTLSVNGTATITDTSIEISVAYRGSLEWSGAANGTCDIDMDAYLAVDSSGGSASAEYRFSGEICGHDAEAVMEATAEAD